MSQAEAVFWLQEVILLERVDIAIHLDGLQPSLNTIIIQWANTILNCVVVVIRPAVGNGTNTREYNTDILMTVLLESL